METKRIMFTGGGTAGHVIVNLALIPHFIEAGWQIDYVGSIHGIERDLVEPIEGVRYYPISTGKLRRYLSLENIKDPFRVLKGIGQSWRLIRKTKPNIIFSKGGFVSVPVVIAARLARVPTIIHESDITPGLANKIAAPFAKQILTTFPETVDILNKKNSCYVGPIIRESLFEGEAEAGYRLTGFHSKKPVLLIMGGSSGSQKINQMIRQLLPDLLLDYQILHICGAGNLDPNLNDKEGYCQFEYVQEELKDLFAITDFVVSRAGANAIFELLALQIPMLLIPLSLAVSRGDQIANAQSFEKQKFAHVLQEEEMTEARLLQAIHQLQAEKASLKKAMTQFNSEASREQTLQFIQKLAR